LSQSGLILPSAMIGSRPGITGSTLIVMLTLVCVCLCSSQLNGAAPGT
jgi:hypothetical protein